MATYTRRFTNSDQHWIIRFLPLETLSNAQALARRFRKSMASATTCTNANDSC